MNRDSSKYGGERTPEVKGAFTERSPQKGELHVVDFGANDQDARRKSEMREAVFQILDASDDTIRSVERELQAVKHLPEVMQALFVLQGTLGRWEYLARTLAGISPDDWRSLQNEYEAKKLDS